MALSETIEKGGRQYTIYYEGKLEPYPWIVDVRDVGLWQCGVAHLPTLRDAREWVAEN